MKNVYNDLKDISFWNEYMPLDGQYYTYKNNITFAACKISDLYYQVCNARMSIHFCLDYEKYSMMSEDKMAILSTKKYFIENALLYYNFAVDYLWQVLWFYYNNADDVNQIPSNELYQKLMKECNLNDLIRGLVELQERKIAEVLKDNFTDRNKLFKQIREYYNYLKHRAIFHTPSLGINEKESMYYIPTLIEKNEEKMELVSYKIPIISRIEIDIDELKELLIEFDKQFVGICEYFFEIIMPKDYIKAREVKLSTIQQYTGQHLEELKEYGKNHPKIVSKMECEVYLEEK